MGFCDHSHRQGCVLCGKPLKYGPMQLRVSRISIRTAVAFAREELGVEMPESGAICRVFRENLECIGARCPYYPKEMGPGRDTDGAAAAGKTE